MADPTVQTVLAALPMLAGLAPEVLVRVEQESRRRKVRAGQVLFLTGDPGDHLVVVLTGRLQVSVSSADGAELILGVVGPAAVVGELGVVDGGARSADATTLDAGEVLLVPRALVLELADTHPVVRWWLMEALAAGLRRLTDATSDLVFLDLPRRVAKLLLAQSDGDSVRLGLTQTQLASRLGGTRQSVNAALRGFERRGWLVQQDRVILLQDRPSLQHFAGTD